MIVCSPTPAISGSKTPSVVTPVPVQFPPGVVAVSVIGSLSVHMVVTVDVIVASGVSITFIVMLSSPVQPFCVTVYVIVCSPAPAVSGLNVPFV